MDFPKFVLFDDLDDGSGELLQVEGLTDWLNELIENNYIDSMFGVFFELGDSGEEEAALKAAGIPVRTMKDIVDEFPDEENLFGYSWGNPIHFDVMLPYDYVNEMGCTPEDYGVTAEDLGYEDEYADYDDDEEDEE